MRSAIRNGVVIKESEAVLPVTMRAVQYSFSIYEALRITDGHVVHLADHLARLAGSARDISLVHPFSSDMITASLDALIAADSISDATARILIVGGESPLLFITYQELLAYPDSFYDEGVDASLYYGERFLPQAKTSNLLMQYIALEEARAEGCFEALLVNRSGYVLEGTRSNFYGILGKRLYTAPDELVLSGITRISVLRAASKLGLDIEYLPLSESSLSRFDSLFISSTSMGAMPLRMINRESMNRKCWDMIAEISSMVRRWEKEDDPAM